MGQLLLKLQCTVDPTDAVAKMLPYIDSSEKLGNELLSLQEKINLTPEELLEVIELSYEFKRSDLSEMMAKDCSSWKSFAE